MARFSYSEIEPEIAPLCGRREYGENGICQVETPRLPHSVEAQLKRQFMQAYARLDLHDSLLIFCRPKINQRQSRDQLRLRRFAAQMLPVVGQIASGLALTIAAAGAASATLIPRTGVSRESMASVTPSV